jgi:phospholipase D-like protein
VSWFWWLLVVVVVFVWVATIVDLIRRRNSLARGSLFAWILLVLILPVIGSILYLIVNGASGGRSGEPGMGGSGRMM